MSWGLSKTLQVQKGILLSSDNTFYNEINLAVGKNSKWVELRKKAFGITTELNEAVKSGLLLYIETVDMLEPILQKEDLELIQFTIKQIKNELNI